VQAIALIDLASIDYYLQFFLICEYYTCSDPRLIEEIGILLFMNNLSLTLIS
jgi:hypothetical protein